MKCTIDNCDKEAIGTIAYSTGAYGGANTSLFACLEHIRLQEEGKLKIKLFPKKSEVFSILIIIGLLILSLICLFVVIK